MRIGIACYPTYGGSGVVASELGLELARRGHEVHVISYAMPFRLQGYHERVYYHELEVTAYPLFKHPPFTLSAACKMIEIAQLYRLEVMHVHYAVPWAVCANLAREVVQAQDGQLKVITTLHGTDITLVGNEPAFFEMTRFGIQRSDAVTAVSSYLEAATRTTFGIDAPIHVIHNCVDSQRFQPRSPGNPCKRLNLAPAGEKLMIHVSNFRPVKNVPDVVKTFALVRKELKCRLLMVGDGPELPAARSLAEELGVAADVLFLGPQQAVEDILPCADLFILPSAYESFGLSALEAMSCGLPVIATKIGGLSEVITSGVDGWLCPVGDCRCMAQRACAVLTDDEHHEAMGRAARKKAVEHFSPDRIVPQYEELYRTVISTDKGWKLVRA
ncbi:MAG: N-acetyl-alpha-D-glucosaminyl L-malate synthase BshA [Planctomycetota bacterium]|nr:N-acetyl-alpha-D-glucosaminyl L-malate synthase BshA [Planctomycetota bacterium]